jgi:hypothetical protein
MVQSEIDSAREYATRILKDAVQAAVSTKFPWFVLLDQGGVQLPNNVRLTSSKTPCK